jgi:putative ABC transport system substrate-binding protein
MNDPKAPPQRDELKEAARKLGVVTIVPEVAGPEHVPSAMQTFARERADIIIVLQTTMILSERSRIAELAAAYRLPTVYGYRQHVDEGGLVSYGVDLRWCFHRAASYVDKILKGAAPRDLPVEFPSRLQMVINLKAAKALDLSISPILLSRADEVID